MCTLESTVLSLDFSDVLVWMGQLNWFTWTWEGHQTQYFPGWYAKLFDIRQKSVHIDIKHIILYTWVQHQSKTDELVHRHTLPTYLAFGMQITTYILPVRCTMIRPIFISADCKLGILNTKICTLLYLLLASYKVKYLG